MIELIPAIDIINGKCVRLTQGDYNRQKVYNDNPLEVAKEFECHGIKRLHIVDLDGAASNHIVNYKVLEQIATRTSLTIDFGGGIKSDKDLEIAFNSGAKMVTIGSIAVKEPELFLNWFNKYGKEKIILGADIKNRKIAISGWKEESEKEIIDFLDIYIKEGIDKVICTDITQDGMLQGPSLSLYEEIIKNFPDLYLIASGGVSSIKDIELLEKANIPAVIFGKAIYERNITLKDLERFL